MKSKHTPGPWVFDVYDNGDNNQYFALCSKKYPDDYFFEATKRPDIEMSAEEENANAHLIAAAPTMLEALKDAAKLIKTAQRYFPKSIKNSDKFQLLNYGAAIDKAIAEATGEI